MTEPRQIGQRVSRLEDPPLVRGNGRFADDIHLPGMLEVAFLRSPHAHARIHGIDAIAARAVPGVHSVFTLAELSPLLTQERLPLQFRNAELPPDITPFVLAKDEVAYVGEAVAMVLAESRYIAEDAATLIAVDYEPVAVVSDCRDAMAPGSPPAHFVRPGNVIFRIQQKYGDIDHAFATAPQKLSLHL